MSEAGAITESSIPRRRTELAWKSMGEETAVLSADGNLLTTLNPTASVLWKAADGSHDLGQIASMMAAEFDAPLERITEDLIRFAGDLAEANLIECS